MILLVTLRRSGAAVDRFEAEILRVGRDSRGLTAVIIQLKCDGFLVGGNGGTGVGYDSRS